MKQLQADVAVIAAGTAGLAAAVTAAEGGARVVVLEKSASTGGTAKMGSGPFAIESRLQRLKQLMLTREEAFRIFMDWTHWRVNARLVRAFMDKSASTIDWLEAMGVEFLDVTAHGIGNHHTQHTVKGPDMGPGVGPEQVGPASAMMKILAERAGQLGVTILVKTPVKKIFKEAGRVTGVLAEDISGEEVQVRAKAVIIATGGYSAGMPGMPEITGDGIRMAREVGADATEIPAKPGGEGGGPSGPPPLRTYTLMIAFQQPNLMVNLLGERFVNEGPVINAAFTRNAIARQKSGTAFTIFDEDTKKYYVEEGFDFLSGGVQVPITRATNFDAELAQTLAAGSSSIFVADSLEELAAQTGIDPEGLRETVAEYNRACETGRDDIFDKKARYLRPIKNPKFYASKSVSGASDRYYGIRINHKTEVLTQDYAVIPGLYAAGMDAACNIYYDTYPMVLPATAMGFALNSGRIAAENALKYLAAAGK